MEPGTVVYFDIKALTGVDYVEDPRNGLPDTTEMSYVIHSTYGAFCNSAETIIDLRFRHIAGKHKQDAYFVYCWGTTQFFDPTCMTMVTAAFLQLHPDLFADYIKPAARKKLDHSVD